MTKVADETIPEVEVSTPPAAPTAAPPERSLHLNPAVAVIRCSDNEVFLRHGSRSSASHRIEDTEHRGTLAAFVEALAATTSVALATEASGATAQDARDYVTHLLDGQAFLTEEQTRYGHVLAGLGGGGSPRLATVCVLGSGRLAQALARQLGDLLDTPVGQGGDLVEAFEGSDFVVVASDHPDPGLGYDADEAADATATPWQVAWIDGAEILVGPTMVPGLTAGFYDLDTLDESGRTMRMEHQFLRTATPVLPSTAPVPLAVAELAAAYTSMAVLQHLTGRGSYLEGHLLRIDLERMQVIRDRVLRLARTPRDVGSRDDLRHPFL